MKNNITIVENKDYQYELYKAKNTLWYFNSLIMNNDLECNSIKFKNNENLHVWLEIVKIEGNYYSGNLAENGNSQKILINDVIDWMIIEKGRLIGGSTIQHNRDTLDDESKMNFDIDFGVKIDDGNDFFKPDLTTPEGAIIAIENFYTQQSLESVLSYKDFYKEAKNVLIESSIDLNDDLINETGDFI